MFTKRELCAIACAMSELTARIDCGEVSTDECAGWDRELVLTVENKANEAFWNAPD